MSEFSAFGQHQQPVENRGRVVRQVLLYVPIAAGSLALTGLAVYQIATGETGFIVLFTLFGLIGTLTGFQALQYLRDLSAQPVQYQGDLVKKWHKGNLFIFFLPSYYLALDTVVQNGRISRIEDGRAYLRLEDGREGYFTRKELSSEKGGSVEQMVRPGEEVSYKVIGVDGKGYYKLSRRRAEEREPVTKIFSVTRIEYAMLLELDNIKVTCYPHSGTVERIERYDESEKKFIPATSGATI